MKTAILVASVVTMLPSPRVWAQNPAGHDPIRIMLPAGVEPRSCRLQYFLVGPFGGYGGSAQTKLDAAGFEIETVHEGTAAEGLKAVLYCSGYQLQTITFDSFPASAGRTVQLTLKPLGTLPFLGLVRGLNSQNAPVLYVDVDYTPLWVCELFQLLDCGLGRWRIASVKLDTDGKFTAALPDFARDAVISAFKSPGDFTFRIRDQKTGNSLFELKPAESGSTFGRVSVADGYPIVQIFDAELPK